MSPWDGLGTRLVGMAGNEASMRLVSLWDGLGMRPVGMAGNEAGGMAQLKHLVLKAHSLYSH